MYTHSCVVLCNKLVSLNSMRTKTCRLLLYSWYLEQCLKCVKYLVVNIFKTVFFYFTNVLFACIHICAPHYCFVPAEAEKRANSLELELQAVDAGNRTQVLCKCS